MAHAKRPEPNGASSNGVWRKSGVVMAENPVPIATLRERLADAERQVVSVAMSNNFAYTDGSYDAALRVVQACRADLDAAVAALDRRGAA